MMIELEINEQKISVKEGTTVIDAADLLGIYIPRFCYHRKLSIVANCRMCLVEVDGVPKPLPACATLVAANMKVFTASKKALDAQRAVMEFLLINHPLDCPICDQGGECELQDQAMGYGNADSDYDQTKRAVHSEDLGPLVETEMTRCIHCTRCVRFGDEIAGLREMGATDRGEHMEIGTYVKHFLRSEISGNIIDLCPVGALTSKPFRYQARSWEMQEHPMIAPHDAMGSNIWVHTRAQDNLKTRRVMRVLPRENESINENWLSDRDRFSYEGLYHSDRVLKPMVKRNGEWKTIEWQPALMEIADRLQAIVDLSGPQEIGAIAHPNSTVEEFYLLQKWMRALGSSNIDHRLTQLDLSETSEWNLGVRFSEVSELNAVFLIGSNLRHELPLLSARVYKAAQKGASIMALNSMDYEFNYPVSEKQIVPSFKFTQILAEIACALAKESGQTLDFSVVVSDSSKRMADILKNATQSVIWMGAEALNHPESSLIRELIQIISRLSGAKFGALTQGANGAGAWLAGGVPHRGVNGAEVSPGLSAREMLSTQPLKAYCLLGTELEFDSAYPADALTALHDAALVVCLSPYQSSEMLDYADFILPTAGFTENAGSFVNLEGVYQSFEAASLPHGESKPAWKILRVLANFMDLEEFDYHSLEQIQQELKALMTEMPSTNEMDLTIKLPVVKETLTRLATHPIYKRDALIRRAEALQETQAILDPHLNTIRVNQTTADKLILKAGELVKAIQGSSALELPLYIDPRLADDMVYIPAGLEQTIDFGSAIAEIQLVRGES